MSARETEPGQPPPERAASIVSVNVGTTRQQVYHGKEVDTAGDKRPVPGAMLRFSSFDGDQQADRKNHGGPDKAACVYPFDHYAYWEASFGLRLQPGAFSENLTVAGIRETETRIGDIFRAGQAVVQVCQPRVPCSKLAGRLGRRDLPELIHASSFSGFYVRVLEEGWVGPGEAFECLSRGPAGVTIEAVNRVLYRQQRDDESFERILGAAALAPICRWMVRKRWELRALP